MKDDRAVRIEEIRVRDLDDFARGASDESRGDDPVPLTRQRALAYAKNPYANETDVGMLVAYSRGRCAGYLGIMPGRLLKDGALHPVHWFSTWFVAPEFRTAGVAVLLLSRALALKYDLSVTGTSREADAVYRGLGFRALGPLVFRRFALSILARAKRLVYEALLRPHRRALEHIVAREVDRFPDDSGPRPGTEAGPPRFYRGVPVINWMLTHPWIVSAGETGPRARNYAFSDARDRFRYVGLEIHGAAAGERKGHLVLSVSTQDARTVLKVLDFNMADETDTRYVFPLALHHASLYGADQIDLPQEVCDAARPGFPARLLLKRVERTCFCRPRDAVSPLAGALQDLRLSYCDGDMAFV